MSTKSSECWTTDPNARALRVEASPDCSILLPFDQFLFSELNITDTGQHLRLIFASHEVTVTGTGLRRIESAFQRMELAGVSTSIERQAPGASSGETKIREIVVTEVSTFGATSHADD